MTEYEAWLVLNHRISRYDHAEDINEALELAKAALEKQIPKKPIFDSLYACPTCHTIMLQGAFEAKGKCCKECGQALDW